MKRSKKNLHYILFPAIVLAVIGLFFGIIGGVFAIVDHIFLKTARQTSATIVDIWEYPSGEDTEYDVFVSFQTLDGTIVEARLNAYSSSMDVGDVLAVYYQPDDPANVRYLVPTQIVSGVFLALGVLLLGVCAVLLLILWSRRKNERQLREYGRRVFVQVQGYRVEKSVRIMGRCPVVLMGTTQIMGEIYTFSFRNFFPNPENLVGKYLTVYYAPEKPTLYAADGPEIE